MAHPRIPVKTERRDEVLRWCLMLPGFLLVALLAACGSADGAPAPATPAAQSEATDPTATSVTEPTSTSTTSTSSTPTTSPPTATSERPNTTVPNTGSGDLWDLSVALMYQRDEKNWLEWQWGGKFTIDGSGLIRGTGLGSIAGSGNCRMGDYEGPPYPLLGGFGVQISGSVDGEELDLQVTGTDAHASFEMGTDPNCGDLWEISRDFAVAIAELNVADLVPDRRLAVPAGMYIGEIEIPELGILTVIVTEP